jgi:hypothetical protein
MSASALVRSVDLVHAPDESSYKPATYIIIAVNSRSPVTTNAMDIIPSLLALWPE